MFYVNIKISIYHIVLKKNLNVIQIYLYNINIYFSSSEF